VTIHIPDEAVAEYGDALGTLQHILETVETTYQQAGVALPERRFYTVGDVASLAVACEQVTVNLVQVYLGTPGQPDTQPAGCQLAMSGDFVVQVTRCVPAPRAAAAGTKVKQIPVDSILEAARVQAIDAQILLEAGYSMRSLQGRSATVSAGGAEGMFQSMVMNLSLSLFRE
jgi:hypothetical protein